MTFNFVRRLQYIQERENSKRSWGGGMFRECVYVGMCKCVRTFNIVSG